MIRIHKSNEPTELANHRNTLNANYDGGMPKLRESLLKEQGYICAYCMSRIDFGKSKIEHIKCREKYKDRQLDYQNMVICCKGDFDKKEHCDNSKKNHDISIDLFSERIDEEITYSSFDGSIKSADKNWDKDINETLCLNIDILKNNRKQVLCGIVDVLKGKNYDTKTLNKKLLEYKNKDNYGKYKPYCGIVIWYIKKKLKQY